MMSGVIGIIISRLEILSRDLVSQNEILFAFCFVEK
jgi:hypothetical protein